MKNLIFQNENTHREKSYLENDDENFMETIFLGKKKNNRKQKS